MKKGLVPALLGVAVTGATLAMNDPDILEKGLRRKNRDAMLATGLIGFGLAHVVLGSIDLFRE